MGKALTRIAGDQAALLARHSFARRAQLIAVCVTCSVNSLLTTSCALTVDHHNNAMWGVADDHFACEQAHDASAPCANLVRCGIEQISHAEQQVVSCERVTNVERSSCASGVHAGTNYGMTLSGDGCQ